MFFICDQVLLELLSYVGLSTEAVMLTNGYLSERNQCLPISGNLFQTRSMPSMAHTNFFAFLYSVFSWDLFSYSLDVRVCDAILRDYPMPLN